MQPPSPGWRALPWSPESPLFPSRCSCFPCFRFSVFPPRLGDDQNVPHWPSTLPLRLLFCDFRISDLFLIGPFRLRAPSCALLLPPNLFPCRTLRTLCSQSEPPHSPTRVSLRPGCGSEEEYLVLGWRSSLLPISLMPFPLALAVCADNDPKGSPGEHHRTAIPWSTNIDRCSKEDFPLSPSFNPSPRSSAFLKCPQVASSRLEALISGASRTC